MPVFFFIFLVVDPSATSAGRIITKLSGLALYPANYLTTRSTDFDQTFSFDRHKVGEDKLTFVL